MSNRHAVPDDSAGVLAAVTGANERLDPADIAATFSAAPKSRARNIAGL
jgi:hypothetical protein